MSDADGHIRFGEFDLDRDQKILFKSGREVTLTPKALAVLLVLVENNGRIVEKSRLLEEVWPDSFVEEGNLAYTVKLLRKGLCDQKDRPKYIETIPRRGYRFIAKVEESAERDLAERVSPQHRNQFAAGISKRRPYLVSAAAAFFIGAVGLGSWYATNRAGAIAILSEPFEAKRLSADGKTVVAVISSDGRVMAYARGTDSDKQSVRLRQLESGSDVEIIPASDDVYYGLAYSPDGSSLFFARGPRGSADQATIYRIPVFGGVPEVIVREAQGWISISPDGSLISFVRCYHKEPEKSCSLWVADAADGKNERKLASRQSPLRIGDNAFSPNGRLVAFVAGHSLNQARETQLYEVDLGTGEERAISADKFHTIKSIAWLPGSGGLLITANIDTSENLRIRHVNLENGEILPLTADPGNYSGLSLDAEGRLLITTQVTREHRLFESSVEGSPPRELPVSGSYTRFTQDGSLVFASLMSGNGDIWHMNSDGVGQRQLTYDAGDDSSPIVSPDGKTVFFSSNRTGEVHVWRMDADGSDQTQITRLDGGFPVFVSGDGRWVYYKHGKARTIWRVRSPGGDQYLVLNRTNERFAISPDGTVVAIPEMEGGSSVLGLVSLADGSSIKRFALPAGHELLQEIAWLPDGETVGYIAADRETGTKALVLQPINGAGPISVTDLGDEGIWSLAFAPDGRRVLIARGGWKHDAILVKGLK